MSGSGFSLIMNRKDMKGLIEEAGGKWQGQFSFVPEETENPIFPFSNSLKDFITEDAGYEFLKKNDYNKFLESIPYISFKGYYPYTALNEIFSLLGKMGIIFGELNMTWSSIEKFFGEASNIVKGLARPNASKSLASNIVSGAKGKLLGDDKDDAVYNLPYALYYRLVTTVGNAYYKIPCNIPNGFFDTNGTYGWTNGEDHDIFNVGGLLKRITSMFHFQMMPFFTPGNGGEGESINIKFDLINDTKKSAINNFKFMQTLMLNNKWLQYGVSQLPGSLYDVKIPGGQRFFMCTGDFKVTYKGILRSIKDTDFGNELKPYRGETKIPDAYSFDLTFKSLLPNNLNNYLFGVAKGVDEMTDMKPKEGVLTDIAGNLVTALQGIGSGEKAESNDSEVKKLANTFTSEEQKQELNKICSLGREEAGKTFNETYAAEIKKGTPENEAREKAQKAANTKYQNTVTEGVQNSEIMQSAIKDKINSDIDEYVGLTGGSTHSYMHAAYEAESNYSRFLNQGNFINQ